MKHYVSLYVYGRKGPCDLQAYATVGLVEPNGSLFMAGDVYQAAMRCVPQIESIAIHTSSEDLDAGSRLRTTIYPGSGRAGKPSLEVRNYASDGRSTVTCTLSGTWNRVTLMAIKNLPEVAQHIRAGDQIGPL